MAHSSTVFALALLLATACASSPALQDCVADAECGAGNLCHAGSCVANAPPGADFSFPASTTTNRPYTITPSVLDPEGRTVTTLWSVQATSGGCAPEVAPQDGAALTVVFWCSGTYAATLTPVDEQGLEGDPITRSVVVAEASGPAVTTGGTVYTSCECDLGGGDCLVVPQSGMTALTLSASQSYPIVGWTLASYPDGVSTSSPPRVEILPDATVASPSVYITTGWGERIWGTYRFRVVVRDGQGSLGQAFQDVVVSGPCTET